MKIKVRKYEPEPDFLRIRDFLSETYVLFGRPLNWRIERWNYARYFLAPMIGMYGQEIVDQEAALRAIEFWESHIAVWETEAGQIVGVVSPENPEFGEIFIQRHPSYLSLLEEMLAYGENHLRNPETGELRISVYDDDRDLLGLVSQRSYQEKSQYPDYDSKMIVSETFPARLPAGFRLRSMADHGDIERRRKVFGLSFNHHDPAEWPSTFSYLELQKAPDYHPERDLFITGLDGEYIACCIFWYDEKNATAVLEPVGTIPAFRRQGFGREVVMEAVRRAAALGAKSIQVGSGQDFYGAIGFERKYRLTPWVKKIN